MERSSPMRSVRFTGRMNGSHTQCKSRSRPDRRANFLPILDSNVRDGQRRLIKRRAVPGVPGNAPPAVTTFLRAALALPRDPRPRPRCGRRSRVCDHSELSDRNANALSDGRHVGQVVHVIRNGMRLSMESQTVPQHGGRDERILQATSRAC